ncbi:hypothetical protein, partial [Escherichia coli]|uniref:hypothetical protein n=1 Tax=Escherichia coli TaxID=562 RepID=UPI001BC830A9
FFISASDVLRCIPPSVPAFSLPASRMTDRTNKCILPEPEMEGANKWGNSSRLTQSFHFFMFEPIFSPVNALNQPI